MQIKTTMRYLFTTIRMTTVIKKTNNKYCEDEDKRESLCTVGRNVNWSSHYRKHYGGFTKN